MQKTALIIALTLAVGFMTTVMYKSNKEQVYSAEEVVAFENWNSQMNKSYTSPAEKLYRLAIFIQNLRAIKKHNQSNASYTQGLNQFTTMTQDEFKVKMLGRIGPITAESEREPINQQASTPESIDWRNYGYVTPVKNQGNCGSCWAFSATGALEAAWFDKTKNLQGLSESQLVDCSWLEINLGCNGGLQTRAFNYYKKNGAISEIDYPYTPKAGKCQKLQATTPKIAGWSLISRGQGNLKQGIAQRVLAVSVNATPWQFYKNGIFTNTDNDCKPNDEASLNHAVLGVGYGTHKGQDFWIIKNSWSTQWGENGYIRLAREAEGGGVCGVDLEVSYPYF